MKNITCKICGKTKEQHHEFEPDYESVRPKGCICDLEEWDDAKTITPVCNHFEPLVDDWELCKNCQHEVGCHT